MTNGGRSVWRTGFASAIGISAVLAFLPAAGWAASIWTDGVLGGAAAGLLSLPICLVLAGFATRRPAWLNATNKNQAESRADTAMGVVFLALIGALLLWRATSDDALMVAAIIIVPAVFVWCWGTVGWGRAKALLFPIGFLGFALPWEYFLRRWLDVPLQEWSADIAAALLALAQHPVMYWNDHTLFTHDYYVIVNETCSGMNMLMTLGMYTLIFGWFAQPSFRARLALVALVFPIAMLANGIRVGVIYLMGVYGGNALAMGFWHTGSAYIIFLPVFWLIYMINGALLDREKRRRATT